MQIIEPLDIGDTVLVSSTIPEPDAGEAALWVPGTDYAEGTKVRRDTTHRVYSRLVAGGDTTTIPEHALDTLWYDEGAVNRWRMFQLDRNTASTSDNPIVVTVAPPSRTPCLALFGVVGQQVTVETRKGGALLDTRTFSMRKRDTRTWSQYFWGGFTTAQIPSLVIYDLLPVSGAEITVTISGGTGPYALSALVVGQAYYVGAVDYGAQDSATNYSSMERTFDGDLPVSKMIRRRSVERGVNTIAVPKELVPQVRRLRQRLNAKVAVYVGLDDLFEDDYFESVLKLGFYKQFDLNLDYPDQATLQLEVEEI